MQTFTLLFESRLVGACALIYHITIEWLTWILFDCLSLKSLWYLKKKPENFGEMEYLLGVWSFVIRFALIVKFLFFWNDF